MFICSFRCLKSERNVLGQKKEGGEFWCQLPFKYNITVSSNYILWDLQLETKMLTITFYKVIYCSCKCLQYMFDGDTLEY